MKFSVIVIVAFAFVANIDAVRNHFEGVNVESCPLQDNGLVRDRKCVEKLHRAGKFYVVVNQKRFSTANHKYSSEWS